MICLQYVAVIIREGGAKKQDHVPGGDSHDQLVRHTESGVRRRNGLRAGEGPVTAAESSAEDLIR